VVTIIAILAGLVLSTVGYVNRKGAASRAQTEVTTLAEAIENYKLDFENYPSPANLYSELTAGGPVNTTKVYFEPPDCYTIRHSGELPTDLTNPPLSGLLIRQRAQQPPKYKLRLTCMPREAKELKALSRSYVRPTKAELRLLQKAFEAADREDRGVQMSYVRRQLVRLVLPDVIHFGAVLNAASARNADLLRTMGVEPSQAALSPKVLSELLVPLTPPAIDVVLATVTLQRVWRSIACRAKVQPSLTQRLIRLRASTRMQRWWRWCWGDCTVAFSHPPKPVVWAPLARWSLP
jgi:hypothetical protein